MRFIGTLTVNENTCVVVINIDNIKEETVLEALSAKGCNFVDEDTNDLKDSIDITITNEYIEITDDDEPDLKLWMQLDVDLD